MSITTPRRGSHSTADRLLAQRWSDTAVRVAGLRFIARGSRDAAQDLVDAASAAERSRGEHVHLANAWSVALADTRADVDEVFGAPRGWLLPDGRPLTWVSALRRDDPRLRQVRGPGLLLDVADAGRRVGLRHYLLGGTPEVLEVLRSNLEQAYPGIEIVGAASPPFHEPSAAELRERDLAVRRSGAQIVWVGLGTPKQDIEAQRLATTLPVVAVAVGAAFDYAAGALRTAPHWVSFVGFEWLWRLAAEPRRLWRRYTIGNLQFLRAVVRGRRRGIETERSRAGAPSRSTHGRRSAAIRR